MKKNTKQQVMSDHEFEKQVRQKLDDLKITPSSATWENIEETVRKRRRRAPLVWLPILLLGIAAGGYVIYNNSGKNGDNDNSKVLVADATKKEAGVMKEGNKVNEENELKNNEVRKNSNELKSFENGVSDDITITNKEIVDSGNKILRSTNSKKKHKPAFVLSSRKTRSVYTGSPRRKNIPYYLEIPAFAGMTGESVDISSSIDNNPTNNTLKNNLTTKNNTKTPSLNSTKKSQAKLLNKKWAFAITAYAGFSTVSDGDLKSEIEDVSYVEDFGQMNVPPPSYTPLYSPPPSYTPSTISPGLAYSAGAIAKYQFSKRWSISAGLNYMQLNTRSRVGQRINNSQIVNNGTRGYLFVPSYYLLEEEQPSEYKNRYHFIELPVSVHYQINKGKKLPVYLNGGMAISRLVESNSLHFDGTTGVYYRNNKLLNKTQAAISTGFSFAMFSGSKRPLWVGPSAKGNLSTILKKDVSASKHFVSLGLDFKWFLK